MYNFQVNEYNERVSERVREYGKNAAAAFSIIIVIIIICLRKYVCKIILLLCGKQNNALTPACICFDFSYDAVRFVVIFIIIFH